MTGLSAIILAAGKGTRMKSDLPKVVHPVADAPMVCWVVDACIEAGCDRIVVVVGYKQEDVRAALESRVGGDVTIEFAVQEEQHGTGHAVQCAAHLFEDAKNQPGHTTFVLAGDGPLIRSETLTTLLQRHRSADAAASMATAVLDDPSGYGRIVRDADGRFEAIVEQKNATPEQLNICEVNPSYYCFDTSGLFTALERVERNPVSGEYYITDVPALLLESGRQVEVIDAVPAADVLSINTLEQLADVDAVLRARLGMPGATATGASN